MNLWRTYDRLKGIEEELFGQYHLSAQQYNLLRLLRAAYPNTIPVLALGKRLISRAPDITRLVDRLEERRLVGRERRTDNRRVVEVGITEAGLALLDELATPVRDCHRRQLGHLSHKQLAELTQLLEAARDPHEEPHSTWKPPVRTNT